MSGGPNRKRAWASLTVSTEKPRAGFMALTLVRIRYRVNEFVRGRWNAGDVRQMQGQPASSAQAAGRTRANQPPGGTSTFGRCIAGNA